MLFPKLHSAWEDLIAEGDSDDLSSGPPRQADVRYRRNLNTQKIPCELNGVRNAAVEHTAHVNVTDCVATSTRPD